MMIDPRKKLNPSQYAAVTSIDGPLLVIAGAGSGKTRVIEYRVLHLVQSDVSPHAILLLTFTRRAAREMLSRASRHDPRCRNVEGGTFHSFAYRQLHRHARHLGFGESFSVLDEGDAEEAIHRCGTKLGFYNREKRFPKKDTLRTIISMSINKNASLVEVLKKEYPHFLEYAADIDALRREYTEYKITKNYLDYDDLLVYLKLLLDNSEVRDRLSERYRYIMVDEYQDTNKLQGDITALLAEHHRNVMVVGDDAQSIYGFRGASHENIMNFPRRFPECRIIKLEENYRSSQAVLDVANAVLENMKYKYSKCLVSAGKKTGEKPLFYFFKDAYEEADWVAGRIKQANDEGIPLGHQAVLFRSLYLSIPLQGELSRRNIPYETFGGLKFYETAHVKDLMAHLKVLANPKDELGWSRILMLIDGIGPKISGRITDEVLSAASFEEVVEQVLPRHSKGSAYSEGLRRLQWVLRFSYDEKVGVGEKFDQVLEYYQPMVRERFDDWHLRLNDLDALRQISMRYDTLSELLEDFSIEPPERGVWRVEPETPEEEKPVTLSTIHSAKGLEWECVYLIGLADGVLPVSFSLDNEEEIEEEQRLLYVGITRAQGHLCLSLHHEGNRGGITQFNKISRFIDVPNVISKLDLRGAGTRQLQEHPREEAEPVVSPYDKSSLLRRIMEFYK
ncbi:MAG: ATP-dependent helicase [Chloroflexota bacterium]